MTYNVIELGSSQSSTGLVTFCKTETDPIRLARRTRLNYGNLQ